MLAVELVAYETADFGVTAVIPGFGFLSDVFPDPYLVKWEIGGGVARSEELPGVAVPEAVFAGVVGVAPSRRCWRSSGDASRRSPTRGGPVADSMPEAAFPPERRRATDDPAAGDRRQHGRPRPRRRQPALLPVDVPRRAFSIGDLHFAQGDGEVCGTAIEVAGAVTVRFALRKGRGLGLALPAYETPAGPGSLVRHDRHSRVGIRWT